MATLYDVQTKQPANIPESQIDDAVKSGNYAFKKNEQINVIDPTTKETVSVSSKDIKDAIDQGYSIETPSQQTIRNYVEENKGLRGTTKVALGQFSNQFLLGLPEIVAEKKGDPLEVAKWEALKKDHSAANIASGIAGFGGSFLYGGPLFKASSVAGRAASSILAKGLEKVGIEAGSKRIASKITSNIIKNASRMGVEAEVQGLPQTITETALADEGKRFDTASEAILMNGALGAVLGTGLSGIKGLKAFAPKLSSSIEVTGNRTLGDKIRTWSAEKALGFYKSDINQMNKFARKGEDLAAQFADTLGQTVTSNGEKVIKLGDSIENIHGKVSNVFDNAGSKIGNVIKVVDDKGMKVFNPNELADVVEMSLGDKYTANKAFPEISNEFSKRVENLRMYGDQPISFADAQKLKSDFNIGYKGADNDKKEMYRQIYGIINKEIENKMELAASKLKDPGLFDTFMQAKKEYRASLNAGLALEKRLAGKVGNKFIGLTDTIIGGEVLQAFAENLDKISELKNIGMLGLTTLAAKKLGEKYGASTVYSIMSNDGLMRVSGMMKKQANKIGLASRFIEGKSGVSRETLPLEAMRRLLQKSDGKNKEEMLQDIDKKLEEVEMNFVNNKPINDLSDYLAATGAPGISQEFRIKMQNMIGYLRGAVPKNPYFDNPLHQTKWKASDSEIAAFERKLHALEDPFSILHDYEDDTLTRDKIEAVRAIYPETLKRIQQQIIDTATEKKMKPLNFKKRLKLSMLMDAPIDRSFSHIVDLQFGHMKGAQMDIQQQQETNRMSNAKFTLASQSSSRSQQIASRSNT